MVAVSSAWSASCAPPCVVEAKKCVKISSEPQNLETGSQFQESRLHTIQQIWRMKFPTNERMNFWD